MTATHRIRSGRFWSVGLCLALLSIVVFGALGVPLTTRAQNGTSFPALMSGQRVYDETGTSLTPEQQTALEQQLADLGAVGADAIVYVRAVDATPEQTLDQVEALQQAWVATSGADQDNAVAILINRNPNDANDARAGIYVGKTFDDGNVPSGEQRAIVDDALIPPLRNGDVYGSLQAGLTRLQRSIVEGPPQNAFERWATRAGGSWLPWAGLGLAAVGTVAALGFYRRREQVSLPEPTPTLARPGRLSPALASALVSGSPQISAVPATILDLAARGALAIEPESEGGTFSRPKVQLRLIDQGQINDETEAALWHELERKSKAGIVSSKEMQSFATGSKPVKTALQQQMRDAGWVSTTAPEAKGGLILIAIAAGLLTLFGIIIVGISQQWEMLIAVVPLVVLTMIGFACYGMYSNLTRSGQEAAVPWKAYRDGLKQAAKDQTVGLNLDDVLADTVAMNLGSAMDKRLKVATESGQMFRAFSAQTGGSQVPASFPFWIAYSSTMSSSTGSAATVSGGGAGGGGGAAGST